MTDTTLAIETERLTRDYKSVRAVDGLTLAIAPGELFGLVGPDGAGKTTTLRLLAGPLDISEGDATILGFDLKESAESIKPHIGYMAQQFSLYGELPRSYLVCRAGRRRVHAAGSLERQQTWRVRSTDLVFFKR